MGCGGRSSEPAAPCPVPTVDVAPVDAGPPSVVDAAADALAPAPCAPSASTQIACFDSPGYVFGTSVDRDACTGAELDAFFAAEQARNVNCYSPSNVHPDAHVWCCSGLDPCEPTQLAAEACAIAGDVPTGRVAMSACADRWDGCAVRGDFLCCPPRP